MHITDNEANDDESRYALKNRGKVVDPSNLVDASNVEDRPEEAKANGNAYLLIICKAFGFQAGLGPVAKLEAPRHKAGEAQRKNRVARGIAQQVEHAANVCPHVGMLPWRQKGGPVVHGAGTRVDCTYFRHGKARNAVENGANYPAIDDCCWTAV